MMPNWCSNEIDIIASPDNHKEFQVFLKKIQLDTFEKREAVGQTSEDEGNELFCRLIPMPKKLESTDGNPSSKEMEDAFNGVKTRRYSDWYSWRIAHWGCKWDVTPQCVWGDDHSITIAYDSPWGPATEFWGQVASKFPSLTIKQKYFEEGNDFIGETTWMNGLCTKQISSNITQEVYVAAGCLPEEDGTIDWDKDHDYCLWNVFENGLEKVIGE